MEEGNRNLTKAAFLPSIPPTISLVIQEQSLLSLPLPTYLPRPQNKTPGGWVIVWNRFPEDENKYHPKTNHVFVGSFSKHVYNICFRATYETGSEKREKTSTRLCSQLQSSSAVELNWQRTRCSNFNDRFSVLRTGDIMTHRSLDAGV